MGADSHQQVQPETPPHGREVGVALVVTANKSNDTTAISEGLLQSGHSAEYSVRHLIYPPTLGAEGELDKDAFYRCGH